ncbi:helix-turn-helix domain-containing protein [Candidatus Magnetaquicoccus inordinatus]|jgi:transcriptional regulator with XRE-family HTH domain|uniref:helix-turn-helix domain-containing protein n=1 Tax=Candidatus Magnetaquicoccus inordinatus TaxID=2496818 RepID=UPI00102AA407|nr:helix-turn-helix transcriptional regulator [Candidatus Magnetaquicoccus inordinatus]
MSVPLGEKIHTLRKEKNMTLDQLGALTGSSKSYLWELERGRIPRPSADNLLRIAQALDITASYLVDEDMEQPDYEAVDQVFFCKYRSLPSDTRKKVRDLVDVWSKA